MAADRMLRFVERDQNYPDKRSAEERAQDFREIAERYAAPDADAQAARCSQCGVPYCSVHCPLHNHIPDWLRLTAEGRLREAYELSNATSTMPEICGRICPQDRLCEGNCVIEFSGHGAVTIGSVEKYITDTAWAEGWVEPVHVGKPTGQSVGIVGAGPAGLTAAEYLRVAGHEVHVYDRHDRAGGLLTYGIPGFKLEKDVVMRRIERLVDAGIHFHLGFEVGADATLDQLRQKHDALLIATGVYKPREINVPGNEAEGVVAALDYLIASNRKGFGDEVAAFEDGRLNAMGKHVVVIGGGDTAMDCVRTAVRQGARSVKCLYRRDRENMPGSQREVANAEEEGVEFVWLAAPEGFTATRRVKEVAVAGMRLGAPDASGRRSPEADPERKFDLPADMVIKALGFDPEELPHLFGAPDLSVTRWGTLRVDHQTMMTSLPGVFAAGDIVRGASLVVWGIRDGRDVSEQMAKWLKAKAAGERQAA
ncbi:MULTISPECIES: NAD(P)-dependent oxidoreductase [unclassified Sphingopyxis]|uniref:NAD(P)-dependent oxidoreductase n=1 Tax=unclassified Sphingopyxis TaxID=2614943 RepID=UPI00073681ED|nr:MULTISPECIES: NAD(P)-dependent oxidoreductase [unclassified Sphingopyxis]KTE39803.1 dihydropyrimidine dehydrogenase [Sphingopyxis sp. HIX]KTE84838.1 dihydropyrimidine dehydrogenase [Sphingopyxis sp. HXXIV]